MIIGIDPGTKNLALCQIDENKIIKNWEVISVHPDPEGILKSLTKINLVEWFFENEVVVIERQPSKNPRAQRIQYYLEFFAVSHGAKVYVIDPKHKLSYASTTQWFPKREITNWTYNERKKLSVETVTNFLKDTDQDASFIELFENSKKKDDLADALLHCLAYQSIRSHVPKQRLAVRSIRPVKPTEKQLTSGKFTQGGLKFLAKNILSSFDIFQAGVENIHGFCSSACKHFEDLENCYIQLGGK